MSNAGPYAVAVSDATGTVMSDNASLTVLGIPVVLTKPPDVQMCHNSNLVLAAGLGGGVAQSIFWTKLTAGATNVVIDGGTTSGAATATLRVSGVQLTDAATYTLTASNVAGAVTSTGGGVVTVFGDQPFAEHFEYPPNSGLGQGGTNVPSNLNPANQYWAQVNTSAGGNDILVTNLNLSEPGLAVSAGNAVRYLGINGIGDRLCLGPDQTSGAVYLSMLLKLEKIDNLTGITTNAAAAGILAGFNNTAGTQTGPPSVIGTRLLARRVGTAPACTYNLGVEKNDDTVAYRQWDTNNFTTNAVVFVVGSYQFVSGNNADISRLWVNPATNSFGAATPPLTPLAVTNGNNLSPYPLRSFVLNQRANNPDIAVVDELRIGQSWAEVTPPPPPIATTLIGARKLGNGAFQFTYTNSSGPTGSVYASTNLANWTVVGTATQFSPGWYQFTDPAATNYPRRFYQLRSP